MAPRSPARESKQGGIIARPKVHQQTRRIALPIRLSLAYPVYTDQTGPISAGWMLSSDLSPPSTNTSPKPNFIWLVYLLFGGLMLVLIFSATRLTLANAPSREAVAELEPYGLVTIRFSTEPNPPLPSGTVGLSFTLVADRRPPVEGGGATFGD